MEPIKTNVISLVDEHGQEVFTARAQDGSLRIKAAGGNDTELLIEGGTTRTPVLALMRSHGRKGSITLGFFDEGPYFVIRDNSGKIIFAVDPTGGEYRIVAPSKFTPP